MAEKECYFSNTQSTYYKLTDLQLYTIVTKSRQPKLLIVFNCTDPHGLATKCQ